MKKKAVGGGRLAVGRRRSLIKTTKRAPRWRRELDAAVKGLKRQALNALAGVGLVTVLVFIASKLGGG